MQLKKIKIKFAEAVQFAVTPQRQIQTWPQATTLNWMALIALARAERPKFYRRHTD